MDWHLPYATVHNLYSQAFMKQPKSAELFDVVAHTPQPATEYTCPQSRAVSVYNNSPPKINHHLSSAPPVSANMTRWDAQEQPAVSYLNMMPHTIAGLTLNGIFNMGVSTKALHLFGLYANASFTIHFITPFDFIWHDNAAANSTTHGGTYQYQRANNNKYAVMVLTFTGGYQLDAEMMTLLGIASFMLDDPSAVQ
jgi:hypothetical protein